MVRFGWVIEGVGLNGHVRAVLLVRHGFTLAGAASLLALARSVDPSATVRMATATENKEV